MPKNTVSLAATGQAIPAGVGVVNKLIVNTHSSGVVKLVDSPNSPAGRAILDTYTVPAGAQTIDLNLEYYEGVHFVLVSGTGSFQLSYSPA